MTETVSEETIPLNTILSDINENNKIEKYFKLYDNIKTITRMGPYGMTALHCASIYGYSESIQLLLTNRTLKSFENISYELTSNNEFKMNEIKKLFLKNSNLFHSHEEIQDYDYIECSLTAKNLIEKRKQFREEIDLYKTYDNQHHLITKLLIEIIEYYLNDYLIKQEQFSKNETNKLESFFKQAIQEQNYLKYFIKAYTLTNNFHRVLNKHLALYILDYFDTSSYSSSPTKYHLINCLVHIVTLLINHPDIQKYKYKGITYRGLLLTRNDLKHYTIGNHILNRSFASTSKNRSVAQIFAGNNQENILQQTLDHQDFEQISVLLKYTIKQNQTAIDIEHLSTVQDEKEVLILPFSVFQIKDRIENNPILHPPVLVEIDLEECEDDQQINNNKEKRKVLVDLRFHAKKRRKTTISQCICIGIVLFIISSLIMVIRYIIINKTQTEEETTLNDWFESRCPKILNRSVWNADGPKSNYTILSTPVSYVAMLHTAGNECENRNSCISIIQHWQRFHMITNGWDDIGYNFLVGGDGRIYEGRGWNYTGRHCYGYNDKAIGIGVIGDYTTTPLSRSVITAIRSLINCGILSGRIENNYTYVKHGGYGIRENYILNLTKSHHSIHYCIPKPTTVLPK